MTTVVPESPPRDSLHELGTRLARLRGARSLTLREVEAGSGLTLGFLSRLERGQTNISVGNLRRLADFYGVSLRELFDDGSDGPHLTRAGERRDLAAGQGDILLESLTPPGSIRLGAVLVRAAGGARDVAVYPHRADELTIVLAGAVRYRVGDTEHVLFPHDAIFHTKEVVHGWTNASEDEEAVLLTVSTPATL